MKRALAARTQEARFDEPLQVMAQGRSGHVDVSLNVAGRRSVGAALNDEAQNGEPNGMTESRELLGVTFEFRAPSLLLLFSN